MGEEGKEGKASASGGGVAELVHVKAFPKISSDSNQNKENFIVWMVVTLLPKSDLLR